MTITIDTPDLALRSHAADWNRDRWEKLPDDGNRYEVIDGILYMTTAPSFFHQWVVRQIALALIEHIDRQNKGITIWSPVGLFMPGCDPVQPDLLMIPMTELSMVHDRRIFGVPGLLVEVLSPTNPETDAKIKREVYARAAVPEYWMVRPATRDIVVCSQPDPLMGDFLQVQHVAADEELVSPTLSLRIAIAAFFAGSPDTTL